MFQEKFFEKERISESEKESAEISEEVIDEAIKENPQGFLSWFENLKNSVSEWPKKFFENKTIKNAIIYTSIPFAVLSAAKQEVKAEDIVSEFINRPTISKKIKTETPRFEVREELKIAPESLISLTDDKSKEALAKNINQELYAFDKLSDTFGETVGRKDFNFSQRMRSKINEANSFFGEISQIKDKDLKQKKKILRTKEILEDSRFNFKELIKTIPEIILAQKMSVLVHELGHEKEALRQGVKNVKIEFNLFGGYIEAEGKIKNKPAVSVAGINADKAYGEFLVNNLREQDATSQLLAIMALTAKSDGMLYALSTNFTSVMKEYEGNDIIRYAKNTNTSVSELALGLTADFILDKDNWNLIKIALGKDGVKIPKATLAPMYELGDRGPIIGIKWKGVF